jgi:hypothetical protein
MKKIFLMSLVPSFPKLNDDKNFIAKVEVINVMKSIRFYQPDYHVSSGVPRNFFGGGGGVH